MQSESTTIGGYHFQFNSEKQWSQTKESVSFRFQFDLKRMVEVLSSISFAERHEMEPCVNNNSLQTKNSSICNDFTHEPVVPKIIDQMRLKYYKNLVDSRDTKLTPVATQRETDVAKVGSFSSSMGNSNVPMEFERDLQDISKLTISTNICNLEMLNNDCISSNSPMPINHANDDKIKTELDDWLEDILH